MTCLRALSAVLLLASCASAPAAQDVRRVMPEAGRAVELAVDERIRIDAPDAERPWVLTGGDGLVVIVAGPGSRTDHWILTGLKAGTAELVIEEGAGETSLPPDPGNRRPAPPRLVYPLTVR